MKNLFKGYYERSEEEYQEFFKSYIVFFDTNVLLDFYRYSEDTNSKLIGLIEKEIDNIYIPFQVAREFHLKRRNLIYQKVSKQNEFETKIKDIVELVKNNRVQPLITKDTRSDLINILEKVENESKETKQKWKNFESNDPIYNKLSELFKFRITENCSREEYDIILIEGKQRQKEKIPPGYNDSNSFQGDFIIWKQVLKKTVEVKKNIIFVTNEKKDDWVWKEGNRIFGARVELIDEVKELADVELLILDTERYLTLHNRFTDVKISEVTIKEVKDVSMFEQAFVQHLANSLVDSFSKNNVEKLIELNTRKIELEEKINNLQEQIVLSQKSDNPFEWVQLYSEKSEYEKELQKVEGAFKTVLQKQNKYLF